MTYPHLLLLVLINAAWGLNFPAGKIGTEVFGPLLFSTVRFVIVLIVLLPFIRVVPGQMRTIFLLGLVLGACHYTLMFYALHIAGSLSSVAIAVQLTIPFSTILAIIFLKERIAMVRVIAIAMSFAGVIVIGFAPMGAEHTQALVFVTLAALAMAVASILMRQLSGVGVFNLQAWIALIATASLGIATALFEAPTFAEIKAIALYDYWSPLYSAVGATIFGHGSLYYLLQRYPVTSVAPVTALATLFAIVFGIWFLDDQLTGRIVIGGALTLLGVTIIAIRNAKRSTPSALRVPR